MFIYLQKIPGGFIIPCINSLLVRQEIALDPKDMATYISGNVILIMRTRLTLTVNDSNTYVWPIEESPPGTGMGYEKNDAIWYNLLHKQINVSYDIYYMQSDFIWDGMRSPESTM